MDLPTNSARGRAEQPRRNNAPPAISMLCIIPLCPRRIRPSLSRRAFTIRMVWHPFNFAIAWIQSGSNEFAMVDNGTGGDAVAGDGLYSATIPGQSSGALVAFHVQATDGFSPRRNVDVPNSGAGARMPGAFR